MKKLLASFVIASSILIVSCDNSTKTTDSEKTESKTDHTDVNTSGDNPNQTQIQAGPDSASLKSKSTDIKVDDKGFKVGTKDVNVDIRTGK